MADFLGYYNTSSTRTTVRFAFITYDKNGAPTAPLSAFEAADLLIYKNGSNVQRTSANGVTMTSPFDTTTGLHHVSIDLTDNTDAGFYTAGSWYMLVLNPDETVDARVVLSVVGYFEIGPPEVNTVQLAGVTQSLTDLKDFADEGYDPSTNKVQGVVLTDTLTTYTGNTPQTGDSYPSVNTYLDATISSRATAAAILTTALTEAYAANGVAPTLSELLFLLLQSLTDFAISSTTISVKKFDGTEGATFTLNSSTNPTSRTRTT